MQKLAQLAKENKALKEELRLIKASHDVEFDL